LLSRAAAESRQVPDPAPIIGSPHRAGPDISPAEARHAPPLLLG
jgi:hypothetical protein